MSMDQHRINQYELQESLESDRLSETLESFRYAAKALCAF